MLKVNFGKWVIDVHKSVKPGNFCFVPLASDEEMRAQDKTGTGVLNQLEMYGSVPIPPEAEIVGYIWEGPMEQLEQWIRSNSEFLERLNVRTGD